MSLKNVIDKIETAFDSELSTSTYQVFNVHHHDK